jgi:hypothetical protein
VRENILDRYPTARLRVLVVWFNMLYGDAKALTDLRVLADRRVANYWDDSKTVGRWYAQHVTHTAGIKWDAYFLYGPDARWIDAPKPQRSSGGPVIAARERLRTAMQVYFER